jgi:hypothetical protein
MLLTGVNQVGFKDVTKPLNHIADHVRQFPAPPASKPASAMRFHRVAVMRQGRHIDQPASYILRFSYSPVK